MKSLKALIAGTAFVLSAATVNAEIRVAIMNEPPPPLFSKDSTGEWHGWEIDILNAMCDEMKAVASRQRHSQASVLLERNQARSDSHAKD